MNIKDLKCIEISLKISGLEFEQYVRKEIGPDIKEDWSEQDIIDFLYTDIKNALKTKYTQWETNVRPVIKKREVGLKHVLGGCNPVYLDRPYPNNIHAIKTALGLSNEKLGKMCGLGYTTIANMDRGDRPVLDKYKEIIETVTGFEVERYYEC